MKNKLFLNEDEKNRILGLHKSRISEELNIENHDGELEEADPTAVGGWTSLNAGTGALVGAYFGPIGAVVGAVAGGALGYLLTSGGKSYDKVKKTMSFCRTHKKNFTKPTKDDGRQRELAKDIRDALSFFGNTNLNDLRRALQSCETVVDLCAVAEKYDRMYGETLFEAIDGDIDSEGEWLNYVWLPIEKLVKKTPKKEEKTPPKPKNDTELRVNAAKCGWGDDIEGYKNSGWKCPKDGGGTGTQDPRPIKRRRGGVRYTFDYDQVMKKLNEKCGGTGTQDDKDNKPLNWRGDQPGGQTETPKDPNLGTSTFDSMTAD
jgi:hypothetical protein